MAYGTNFLQCGRCGQPRVVFYLKVKGYIAILKAICPNDHTKKAIRLPVESRDQWIGPVAENMYRCTVCGQRCEPAKIGREGRWIILFMECPTHGMRDARRHVIDTIYPAIEAMHNNPVGAMAPVTFAPPAGNYPPPPPPPASISPGAAPAYLPPPPDAFTPPPDQTQPNKTFCPDCGEKLKPGALFCTSCGMALDDNYDEL